MKWSEKVYQYIIIDNEVILCIKFVIFIFLVEFKVGSFGNNVIFK